MKNQFTIQKCYLIDFINKHFIKIDKKILKYENEERVTEYTCQKIQVYFVTPTFMCFLAEFAPKMALKYHDYYTTVNSCPCFLATLRLTSRPK